jgi:hypothetical protein
MSSCPAGGPRRAAAWVAALAVALAGAGCGGSDDPSPATAKDPFRAIPEGTVVAPADKAAPRWEPVTTFSGSGAATRTVNIADDAIQWRVRWRCEPGTFSVTISPAPRSGSARADGDCPGRGEHSWVASGRRELRVQATGAWRVEVEQEVDTALHEPPLAAMRSPAAEVLARGSFYKVERESRGRAILYRLGNGRLALRMENFRTEANTDLFVWLSEARRPRTTRAAFRARHDEFAALKSTLGDQNYLLPRGADASRIRSIVIWCEPVRIVYAAATLTR